MLTVDFISWRDYFCKQLTFRGTQKLQKVETRSWLRPFIVERLHDRDLPSFGWVEGP